MRPSILLYGVIGLALGVLISVLIRSDDQTGQAPESSRPKIDPTSDPLISAPSSAKPASTPIGRRITEEELNPADVQAMLELRGYSREALVSAALLTGDHAHLKDAAERFPDDPHVQLLVITNDVFPGARSEWIDRFKQSQPDNPLASILKSGDLFSSGKRDEALEQLYLAATQSDYEGFSTEAMLAMEGGLIDLGYSSLDSKSGSTTGLPLPELELVRNALDQLHPLAENAATVEERNELAELGIVLGNQFSQGAGQIAILNRLVGMGTEKKFLQLLDPDHETPTLSATPEVMLAEIDAEIQEIKSMAEIGRRAPELGEAMFSHFLDRMRAQGEMEAIKWARQHLEIVD